MRLVFASQNLHKVKEVNSLLGEDIEVIGLNDIGINEDIPEDGCTLEENALYKARYVWAKYNMPVFADDTGLEVESLNNQPGVHSARYAGEEKDPDANIKKLLDELSEEPNRKARFRTVIALILDGQEYLFDGIVNGEIIKNMRGLNGFGYDPVFVPEGYKQTFAEMSLPEKNILSHRARALSKLVSFLQSNNL